MSRKDRSACRPGFYQALTRPLLAELVDADLNNLAQRAILVQ